MKTIKELNHQMLNYRFLFSLEKSHLESRNEFFSDFSQVFQFIFR